MSKEGFDNEQKIINSLNDRVISELNLNLSKLMLHLYPKINPDDLIVCVSEAGANKSDILIYLKASPKQETHLSIKSGYGNSVHQEPLEDFIKFLQSEFKIGSKLKDDLRFFIWGDHSLNGEGRKSERMSAFELKKKFPEIIDRIAQFMDLHKKELIKRFVLMGPKSDKIPNYIYYGNEVSGIWAKSDKVLDLLSCEKSKSVIPVGKLTFQAWNRAIKEGSRSEQKRGVIQLKWPTLEEDLDRLSKDE